MVDEVPPQTARDRRLLFATRFVRLFAYGSLSVVLVFYLIAVGLTEAQVGLLLTLTLLGDTVVSLLMTTHADRLGRRRMLVAGALLMAGAGLVMAATNRFWLLVLAATAGVISPSGQEVGPFLPIEQAALTGLVDDRARTALYARYALTGAVATALGALAGGLLTRVFQDGTTATIGSYRSVVFLYAVLGALLAVLFSRLSGRTEPFLASDHSGGSANAFTGLGRAESRHVVLNLAALFALDAFGGGFVAQSFAAYWFYLRFGVEPAALGPIFFAANVLAGFSALVASRIAARVGLVRTMVWTHLPSNVLLVLVPLMPTLPLAVAVLLLRFSISQMDVPTRQSYVMAVVAPAERSAAGGVTGVARTVGAAISPLFAGLCFARPSLVNLPFFIAGTLKIVYDLVLYKRFASVRPAEEAQP
ncbi:MAG: MFS transporter [Acidobacteria bacterium]|nr:MAG: MFS transporter [Acidobacteriota bacterium]